MSNLKRMYEAVQFIEAHLREEIAVADVADAVFCSLYHFCRTFNRVVHHTPYDYLMRRKFSESARELVETDKKIIDIAFDYRFNSPEAYARAFKRMFGTQPSQWRKQGRLDRRRMMSRLTLAHLRHRNRGDFLRPVLAEKGTLRLAGVMGLVRDSRSGREVISRLWDVLADELKGSEYAGELGEYYGVVSYPEGWEERGFLFMAAVEAGSPSAVSSALVTKVIPPLRCARFIHKGPVKDLKLTLDYVYQTWLPRSGEQLSHPFEIHCYGQDLRGADREDAETEICFPLQ
jgi:AraC family transcriptional regulator